MAQPRNQLWPFSERFENDRISDGTESTQLEGEVCGDRRERNKIDGCISNRLATWCYCWGGSGTGMLLQLVVGALLCVNVSYTSTHWVVSDDGRLKSVDFSPYLMQEPGDLINFMKQEKRVEEASKLRSEKDRIFKEMSELSNTLADNSQLSSSETNDHEDENGSQTRMGPHNQGDELSLPTEANCSAMLDKNSPMTKEMDHYLSIHLPLTLFHISISDYLDLSQAPSLKPLMPFCNRPMNNPKDQKQFDKLKGFAESSSFEMKPEPDLRQVFDGKDVDRMGNLINEALLKKSDCWVVCSLATLFWRIKGNTQEALRCAKQAYDVSHSSKVPVALVNMAAILHKHHFHADASSLASKALRLTDPAMRGFVHLLLAQIQCTPQMDQLEKCLKNLHAVLSCENHRLGIGPSHFLHNNIRDSIHAYSCLLRYKQQLEKEQNALEKFMQMQKEYHLVSELHAAKMKEIDSYKVSDDEYLLNEHLYKLHTNRQFSDLMDYFKDMEMSSEELERHLALSAGSPLDMEMRLTEEETYILSENPDGSVFLHTDALIEEDIDGNENTTSANKTRKTDSPTNQNVSSESISNSGENTQSQQNNFSQAAGVDDGIEQKKKNSFDEHENEETNPKSDLALPHQSEEEENSDTGIVALDSGSKFQRLVLERELRQFTVEEIEKFNEEILVDSNTIGCKDFGSKDNFVHSLETVFINLGVIGVSIADLLGTEIGVPLDQEHPLPWYPPTCPQIPVTPNSEGPLSESLDFSAMLGKLTRTTSTYEPETHLRKHFTEVFGSERDISDGEIGQRIQTSFNLKVEPDWNLANFASLFWRIVGSPLSALDCLNYAYAAAPSMFRDMIVTNAANILLRAGRHTEATELVYLVDKYHEHYPNNALVLYTSAVGVLHAANYRAAEMFLTQAAVLEGDTERRNEFKKIIRHTACYQVFVAERCVATNDNSPTCVGAHKVLGPLDQYCSCSQSEPKKAEIGGGCSSGDDSKLISDTNSECSSEAMNPDPNPDSDTSSTSNSVASDTKRETIVYSSNPTNFITSQTLLDLKQSSSSREVDYSGPILTRALCTKRGDAQSCLFFRREELGTKFCDHPIACDPKIFHDPRIAIQSDASKAIEVYGKDLYDVEFMANLESKETSEMIYYIEEALAEPLDLVMTVFYKEKPLSDQNGLPRLELPGPEPIKRRAPERNKTTSSPKTNNNGTKAAESPAPLLDNETLPHNATWAEKLKHFLNSSEVQTHLEKEIALSVFKKEKLPISRSFNFTDPGSVDAQGNPPVIQMKPEQCEKWTTTEVISSSSLIQPATYGYKIGDYIEWETPVAAHRANYVPLCTTAIERSPIDDFVGVKQRIVFGRYNPERALREAFLGFANYKLSMKEMANKLAEAIEEEPDSFVLLNMAVIYWRIMGDSRRAIDCIRQTLYYSQMNVKPMAWNSLANVLHKSGFLEDAFFFSILSMKISPIFTTYATTANIRANQGFYEEALVLYEEGRKLNPKFRNIISDMKTLTCLLSVQTQSSH